MMYCLATINAHRTLASAWSQTSRMLIRCNQHQHNDDANQIVPSKRALLSTVPPWRALCHCVVSEEVTMAYLWMSRDKIWINRMQVFCAEV